MLRRFLARPGGGRLTPGVGLVGLMAGLAAPGVDSVRLTGVPDYDWHAGCFGTATGNLLAYWDRHGMADFYTGPTAGGVAPLDSFGTHRGVRSLWASEAGLDGRPATQPGHIDDYWRYYESTRPDPYGEAGRPEHTPDCAGDFIGLNQGKWKDLGGECDGNIDAYSFNFFDPTGERRPDYSPADASGGPIPDIQSGLRAWTAHRGYTADTFSQLTDFNPDIPPAHGFTFADLKGEIDAGYPVLLFMQAFGVFSRTVEGVPHQNPSIHGMLAYGYVIDDDGTPYVRYRTSWASGDNQLSAWNADNWTPNGNLNLPLRGVIGYRPRPKITRIESVPEGLLLEWHGPLATLRDDATGAERVVHSYIVERATALAPTEWTAVTGPINTLSAVVPDCCGTPGFFRLRLQSDPP